jgi:hypothetical protein
MFCDSLSQKTNISPSSGIDMEKLIQREKYSNPKKHQMEKNEINETSSGMKNTNCTRTVSLFAITIKNLWKTQYEK